MLVEKRSLLTSMLISLAFLDVNSMRASFRFVDEFGEETNIPTEDDTFEIKCTRENPNETDVLQVHIDGRSYPKWTTRIDGNSTTFLFKINFSEHNSSLYRSSYSCRANESNINNTFEIGVLFCGRESMSTCKACGHGHTCAVRQNGRVCAGWNWQELWRYCGDLGDYMISSKLNHTYLGLCRVVTNTNPDTVGEPGLCYTCYNHNYNDAVRYYAEAQLDGCVLGKGVPRIVTTNGEKVEVGDTLFLNDLLRSGISFDCGDYGPVGDEPTCRIRNRYGVVMAATTELCAPRKRLRVSLDALLHGDLFRGDALVKLSCYTNLTRSYVYVLQPPTVKVNSAGSGCGANWTCALTGNTYTTSSSIAVPVKTPASGRAFSKSTNLTCKARFDADVCKFQKLELRDKVVSSWQIVSADPACPQVSAHRGTYPGAVYILIPAVICLIGVAAVGAGTTFWLARRKQKRKLMSGTISFRTIPHDHQIMSSTG